MISVELASCEVGQLAELAMGKLRGALTSTALHLPALQLIH